MAIRVPLTPEGDVDTLELRRLLVEEAGETVSPLTAEDVAKYHRERASIELAVGMEHLRRAAEHISLALTKL